MRPALTVVPSTSSTTRSPRVFPCAVRPPIDFEAPTPTPQRDNCLAGGLRRVHVSSTTCYTKQELLSGPDHAPARPRGIGTAALSVCSERAPRAEIAITDKLGSYGLGFLANRSGPNFGEAVGLWSALPPLR